MGSLVKLVMTNIRANPKVIFGSQIEMLFGSRLLEKSPPWGDMESRRNPTERSKKPMKLRNGGMVLVDLELSRYSQAVRRQARLVSREMVKCRF